MNAFRNDNFTISLVFDWLSRDDMENLKHILSDVESHLLDTGATDEELIPIRRVQEWVIIPSSTRH